MKAYVLIETEPGKMVKDVFHKLEKTEAKACKIVALDAITGPYDIIAIIEGPDLSSIGKMVTDSIGSTPGVQRTLTCLAVGIK